jgi:CTP-dependent riboflavin kinase
MRNEIDTIGVFIPTYFTDRKDLTIEEAYLLSLIVDLAKRREKIDYTNQAFSNLMKRDIRTISRWLVLLEKRGYIQIVGKAQNRVILITAKTKGIKKHFYKERGGN